MNPAELHFATDVAPSNIVFHPICTICNGRLRFDYHEGEGFGYRHVPEERHE